MGTMMPSKVSAVLSTQHSADERATGFDSRRELAEQKGRAHWAMDPPIGSGGLAPRLTGRRLPPPKASSSQIIVISVLTFSHIIS
jgi:hypothetical protein